MNSNIAILSPPMKPQTIGYSLKGNYYLNITNKCTLRCNFCPKFNKRWDVKGYELRLHRTPTLSEIIQAVDGISNKCHEVVFCGLGEPTLRLYTLLEVAKHIKKKHMRVRVNTDGLANLVYGRDIVPDLEGNIDALSVSLNAQLAGVYNVHCRPARRGAYQAMLDFVFKAKDYVPEVSLTAINGLPGVNIDACAEIAENLGVKFKARQLGVVG